MGNRLSKIVTKTGDDGTTGLASGKRVHKDDSLVEAIGSVDELNSCIGLIRATNLNSQLDELFINIQNQLFNCGGDLCMVGSVLLTDTEIEALETSLTKFNDQLQPLKNFILPAGSELTARIHQARSVCRRAERNVVTASRENEFNPVLLSYLNRLSDWLFVLARYSDETEEQLWQC
jgi:cob(I)alamin adenosyltransferase